MTPVPTKIKITNCRAFGPQWANCTPGSEHLIIEAPKPYANTSIMLWIMGASGEPVGIFRNEFVAISFPERIARTQP
jgi:hypothetical protein